MFVLAVTAAIHWLAAVSQVTPDDPLSHQVLARVANPLLTSAQFLIPAAVAISGIHKMMEHRERGTVFSTVMRIFNVFTERSVAKSAMSSRFDPDEFLRRRGTLYLCSPRQAPERIASLFVGILMTVVTSAYAMADADPSRQRNAGLGLFLDELANVVPIEDLPALASQGAGRGVMLMSIVQDISQLRARYGADRANTILNNHGCKVILPGITDPETADVLGKLIGRAEYIDEQLSIGADGRITRSYSTRHDSMATPDGLRQLGTGTAIVIHRDSSPAYVSLPYWFRAPRYRKLAKVPYFRGAEHVPR